MKQILDYLYQHIKENPHPSFLLIFAAFLCVSLALRYGLGWIPNFDKWHYRYVWAFGFYTFPYLFTVFLYGLIYQKTGFIYSANFWLLSFLIIFVLFINQYMPLYQSFVASQAKELQYFLNRLFFNLQSTGFYVLIPFMYWYFSEKMQESRFYGCTTENFTINPYLWMLLLMLPLLFWASFRGDFLLAYPRYKSGLAENYWGISSVFTITAFEISYILQFITLEIFFRGFIVLSLAQYLGSGAVYVMVAVYAYLHFFKPMPEAIGSIFGGYILGVIALYSRTVLGGMVVHIGIALLMEIFAYLQLFVFRK